MILLLVVVLVVILAQASPPPPPKHRRTPSNTVNNPDYFASSGIGGLPHASGGDGSVVIITKQPAELRSNFFYTGSPQSYVIPGDARRAPYFQEVQMKLWGGGGGGCDGGRLMTKEWSDDSLLDTSSGSSGGYVEASFIFPIGQSLIVDVGGGGRSVGSQSLTLGGLGGYNGGKSGYKDRSSGGGGGGGMSKVSLSNGTVVAVAFGGNGGGNSSYCSAFGGIGASLRGMDSSSEGFINSELVMVDDNVKDVDRSGLGLALLQENVAPSIPINQWIPVTITQPATVSEVNTKNSTTWCEHSNHRPTGRRGHSMTTVNNHVYIFGGATLKCVCTVAANGEKHCKSKNVYSNELWHFDVPSSMFTLLEPLGAVPRGREQHSATALPNGDIIIIGGMSSLDGTIAEDLEPLNEVWKFSDPHRVISHIISGSNSSTTKLPMELNQTYLSSHTLNVDLGGDICVEDLQLSLSLDHGCPQGIEWISLTGPTSPSAEQQSRGYQTKVKIFVSTAENRERDCYPSLFDLSFSDAAKEAVLSYLGLPKEGAYRPSSSLKETFRGLPINGEWTLSFFTSKSLVEYTGSLLEWKLHMQAKSCTPKVTWKKLSVPSLFSPRHGHTAIATESDSIFILGGFAQRRLSDLWRFDYLSNKWTALNAAAPLQSSPAIHGQAAVLGPWGLLKYGGLKQIRGIQKQGRDLSVQNLFDDERLSVPLFGNDTSVAPTGRYLSAITLMRSSSDVIKKLYSIDGPFLIVFGGDGGHFINSYPNSYGFMPNTFFDDVWILSPSVLNTNNVINRNDHCISRLDRNSTQYHIWRSTCGAAETRVCELGEILVMACCKQQYQSFHTS